LAILLLLLAKHSNFKLFFKGEYTEENKPKEKEDDYYVKKSFVYMRKKKYFVLKINYFSVAIFVLFFFFFLFFLNFIQFFLKSCFCILLLTSFFLSKI
jgi:hypothetical protein